MAQKIFELNGKAYDALTGAYLGSAKRPQHTVTVQAMQPKPVPQHVLDGRRASASGVSMDGMIGGRSGRRASAAATPKHLTAHQPQPTQTLMRRAVTKPATLKTAAAKTTVGGSASFRALQPSLRPSQPYKADVTAKLSSQTVDPFRARRAQGVRRSQDIKHFKPAAAATTVSSTASYSGPGAPQPLSDGDVKLFHHQAAQPQPRQYTDFGRPARAASYRPQRATSLASATAVPARAPQAAAFQAAAAPSAAAPAGVQPLQAANDGHDADFDLFAEALAHASSHEEPVPAEVTSKSSKRRRRQVFGIAASLAVFALLAGFVGFQNRDNIRLQMASAKAGFSAAVPLNMPSGYAMQKLDYAPGSVGMVFSKGSNQSFTVSQKKSNWDSQTLLENFVATSNDDYRGYQSNGRTVYVYGKGKATWVNGGIWYQLQDNGSLTDEQLVRIAASM